MPTFPDNVLDLLNANMGGFNNALGLRFTKATPDEYTAEIEITDQHLQPYGLVHGGGICRHDRDAMFNRCGLDGLGRKKAHGRPGKQHLVSKSRPRRPSALYGPTAGVGQAFTCLGGRRA